MTDIQQWRRMIQPTRAKTPAVDADDAEAFLSPMSPRKGLKPKFTSYFTPQGHDPGAAQKDTAARNNTTDYDTPVWPAGDSYPNPDPDVLLDSVMCRLLGTPYEGLHPRFNSLLLQIFEGFRNLSDEKQQLLSQLQQGSSRLSDIEKAMQKSTRQWSQERHDYKAEIKRLELLLAKGKRGLAEVTLARQDSNLRKKQADRSKEGSKRDTIGTIVDFLEKTKREDEKYWSSQRATMRRKSPSAGMRHLSKTFMSRDSPHSDLLVGTPVNGPSTLAEASFLEEQQYTSSSRAIEHRDRATSDPKTSISTDDTISTFSCAGDWLPDEASDAHLIDVAGTDNDLVAIKRIARILARRRKVDIEGIMPKLLEMFAARQLAIEGDRPQATMPRAQTAMAQASSAPPSRKNTKLMAKASGFFNKLKPQLNVDTTSGGDRFSFETGDDGVASVAGLMRTSTVAAGNASSIASRARALRKCASTPLLAEQAVAQHDNALNQRSLSPVEHSPASSAAPSESKRSSRIPTPAYGSVRLARPRQERDSSESSLLTAIKHSVEVDRRSNSISRSSASSRQFIHGNAFAEAAAIKALGGAGSISSVDYAAKCIDGNRPISSRPKEHRRENVRPMDSPGRNVDHKDDT